jgi:glucose/arabinose dehydrogenase
MDPRNLGARLPQVLAYLYAPLLPLLMRIKEMNRSGPRGYAPKDILLPDGYVAELVVGDLNEPVHLCWDDAGAMYVFEAGWKIKSRPRIWKVDAATGSKEQFFELPEDRWKEGGALTGGVWVDGTLYFCNTGTLSRIGPRAGIQDVVTGLPSSGDHHNNHPVLGPDGKIYFGQGSATNLGVVGADNFAYEWLPKHPQFCDVPAQDLELVGSNFTESDVLGKLTDKVETGAYLPFKTPSRPGQVIPGQPKPTGAIMRCDPDGGRLEVVASGLRNPFGLAFDEQGRLFATEHGSDERGSRFIVGDPDDLYEIKEGHWYGWPDFASGIRLDDERWRGEGRSPVLARFPEDPPPAPFVTFQDHAAANGIDFCRSEQFGFRGDAFVACFGDAAPITARPATPRGFKVVRVDMKAKRVVDFAVNRIQGPASKLPHDGFERPSHCAFGPDGALYVADFGQLNIALERGGVRAQQRSGCVWRIRRTQGPRGERPPDPMVLPLNAMVGTAAIAVVMIMALLVWLLTRR